ncbi:hypothetical protein BDZ45DRAFT_441521 [Acephala macrosclerotiorum]|nr:hypothetical protein BDZ45DRAFT_441521 [Acephala macrosclerotiorum]
MILDIAAAAIEDFEQDIRPLLDPTWIDEVDKDYKGLNYDKLRENGLVVWSTIIWDWKKAVSAWMLKNFIDGLVKKGISCGLYRTGVWTPVSSMRNIVKAAARQGRRWNESLRSEVLVHR